MPDARGEAPWAMQLVCRVERARPPTHSELCAAAARAVVRFLTDPRTAEEWSDPVQRWLAGGIRKHVRRARGAAWERVQALPGVTATSGRAEVRAIVPGPIDALPSPLRHLQLTGLQLGEADPRAVVEPAPGGPVVISVDPDLSTGKAAAAAGHAAQLTLGVMGATSGAGWRAADFPVVIERPNRLRYAALTRRAPVVVRDGGYTEVQPGTITAVARWA